MYTSLKRAFDIVLSLAALVVLAPIMAVLAILIKLDSPGPVFFRQKRIGLGGKPFTMLKFRKMPHHVPGSGPTLTVQNDVRMTRIGRFMERLKFDEFPQFFNILKGDMSIVGPRPETENMVAHYSQAQRRVLSVKPGIFGPNQIRFRREAELYPQGVDPETYYREQLLPRKLENDLRYIDTANIVKDLIITIRAVWVTLSEPLSWRHIKGRNRFFLALSTDLLLANVSLELAMLLKFGIPVPEQILAVIAPSWIYLMGFRVACFLCFGLYQRLWRYTALSDVLSIIKGVGLSTLLFTITLFFINHRSFPLSILLLDWLLLTSFMVGVRAIIRIYWLGGKVHRMAQNVLIFGAGDLGEAVSRQLARNPSIPQRIVGFIDDDEKKYGKIIHGIKVLGTHHDIVMIAQLYDVTRLVVAIDKTNSKVLREVHELCKKAGIHYQLIPGMNNLMDGITLAQKLREDQLEEIIQTRTAHYDEDRLAKIIKDHAIVVFIGSGTLSISMVKQLYRYQPKSIAIFGADEIRLLEIKKSLSDLGRPDNISYILGQPQDKDAIRDFFWQFSPDIVLHIGKIQDEAILRANPDEAIRRNIFGVINIADQAVKAGVSRFILIYRKVMGIETPMGVCRFIAEQYLLKLQEKTDTRFQIIRLADILDAWNGPLVSICQQVNEGEPIHLPKDALQRPYMSKKEAIALIFHTLADNGAGEIRIPNIRSTVDFIKMTKEVVNIYHKDQAALSGQFGAELSKTRQGRTPEPLTFTNEEVRAHADPAVLRVIPASMQDLSFTQDQTAWLFLSSLSTEIDALMRDLLQGGRSTSTSDLLYPIISRT